MLSSYVPVFPWVVSAWSTLEHPQGPDAVLIFSPQDRVKAFSKAGREVLGFSWEIPQRSIQNGTRPLFFQSKPNFQEFRMQFRRILNGLLVGCRKSPFNCLWNRCFFQPLHWSLSPTRGWFFPFLGTKPKRPGEVLQFWSHYRESHTLRASAQAPKMNASKSSDKH